MKSSQYTHVAPDPIGKLPCHCWLLMGLLCPMGFCVPWVFSPAQLSQTGSGVKRVEEMTPGWGWHPSLPFTTLLRDCSDCLLAIISSLPYAMLFTAPSRSRSSKLPVSTSTHLAQCMRKSRRVYSVQQRQSEKLLEVGLYGAAKCAIYEARLVQGATRGHGQGHGLGLCSCSTCDGHSANFSN